MTTIVCIPIQQPIRLTMWPIDGQQRPIIRRRCESEQRLFRFGRSSEQLVQSKLLLRLRTVRLAAATAQRLGHVPDSLEHALGFARRRLFDERLLGADAGHRIARHILARAAQAGDERTPARTD